MSIRQALLLCTVLACLFLSPIAAQAANPHFSAIYVFGDSYCDAGNLFIADGGIFPISPPYYKGRFSNGLVWAEHVAGSWGLPLTPSLAGGTIVPAAPDDLLPRRRRRPCARACGSCSGPPPCASWLTPWEAGRTAR